MPELLEQTVKDGVATIRLNRPDQHNAFNEAMMELVADAFDAAGTDPAVRAVVLAAEGKSFCAGADLNWMKKMAGYDYAENVADAAGLARMLTAIRSCPRPTLARVHGAAFGGGVGLVAACDMSVARNTARFCLSEVRLGIIPAVISPFLRETVTARGLRRYALTAEQFSADEARHIGLVTEVVGTDDELDAWIEAVCRAIRVCGPAAVTACKALFAEIQALPMAEAVQHATKRIAAIRVSDEGQEGLASFLEKRPPNWLEG